MRIRWKVVIPALGAIGSWLASPHALGLVSEEHSHYLLAVSSLILILTPALVTTKPRTNKTAFKMDKRSENAGLTKTKKLPDIDRQ